MKSSSDKIQRVALVGLGEAAHTIHAPAVAQMRSTELVAGADLNAEAREGFAKSHRSVEIFADAEQMLKTVAPDWVIVATPPAFHREVCVMALESGAHVLCEKPFVESSQDAAAILEAQARLGRTVVVNHEFSWMPIFERAQTAMASGELGDILFFQAWEHLLEVPHGPAGGWRSHSLTMREFGTHVLDLAVHLFGALPVQVYAQMAAPGAPTGTDLINVVTLTFADGRLASIVLDRVCRGPHRYLELRLDGTKASYRASFGGRAAVRIGRMPGARRPDIQVDLAGGGQAWLEVGDRRQVVARNGLHPFADATARLFERAIQDVSRGVESASSARRALDIVRLVEAAYTSARTGQPVHFAARE